MATGDKVLGGFAGLMDEIQIMLARMTEERNTAQRERDITEADLGRLKEAHQNEIQGYCRELANIGVRIGKAGEEKCAANAESAELRAQITALTMGEDTRSVEVAKARQERNAFKAQLEGAQHGAAVLRADLLSAKADLDEAHGELSDAAGDIEELIEKATTLQTELEEMRASRSRTTGDLEEARERLQELHRTLNAERTGWDEERSHLTARISAALNTEETTPRMTAILQERDDIRRILEEAQMRNATVSGDLEEARRELEESSDELGVARANLTRAEENLERAHQHIIAIEEDKTRLCDQLHAAPPPPTEKELAELREKFRVENGGDARESELLNQTIEQLSETLRYEQENHAALRRILEQTQVRNATALGDLEIAVSERDEARSMKRLCADTKCGGCEGCKHRLVTNELDRLTRLIDVERGARELAVAQRERFKEQLESEKAVREDFEENNAELRDELVELRRERDESLECQRALSGSVGRLQGRLQQSRKAETGSGEERDELRTELSNTGGLLSDMAGAFGTLTPVGFWFKSLRALMQLRKRLREQPAEIPTRWIGETDPKVENGLAVIDLTGERDQLKEKLELSEQMRDGADTLRRVMAVQRDDARREKDDAGKRILGYQEACEKLRQGQKRLRKERDELEKRLEKYVRGAAIDFEELAGIREELIEALEERDALRGIRAALVGEREELQEERDGWRDVTQTLKAEKRELHENLELETRLKDGADTQRRAWQCKQSETQERLQQAIGHIDELTAAICNSAGTPNPPRKPLSGDEREWIAPEGDCPGESSGLHVGYIGKPPVCVGCAKVFGRRNLRGDTDPPGPDKNGVQTITLPGAVAGSKVWYAPEGDCVSVVGGIHLFRPRDGTFGPLCSACGKAWTNVDPRKDLREQTTESPPRAASAPADMSLALALEEERDASPPAREVTVSGSADNDGEHTIVEDEAPPIPPGESIIRLGALPSGHAVLNRGTNVTWFAPELTCAVRVDGMHVYADPIADGTPPFCRSCLEPFTEEQSSLCYCGCSQEGHTVGEPTWCVRRMPQLCFEDDGRSE